MKDKLKKAEYDRLYRERNKEKIAKYHKEWRKKTNYRYKLTEEQKEQNRKRAKLYRLTNKEYCKAKYKEWRKTPIGRASHQISNYKSRDKKYNREIPDFDAKWMVENIYSKPCYYCGETDWTKLGCDRIDNTKGHTKDNIVTCCKKCNDKRQKQSIEEFKKSKG